MAQYDDSWVQIFDVLDTSKHKKGFTVYKIISMLYPKNRPDSVTKVTVWKRYNDFKKLHRDVKNYSKSLKLKGFPSLPSVSYFHRFDENVIQQRKASILQFLEFVSLNRLLYTSDVCVKFFKTSYTFCDTENSNIQSIRAELNLPIEPEYNIMQPISDDEHTLSDTDSLSTVNSMVEYLPDPLLFNSVNRTVTATVKNLCTSSHDSISISISNTSLDPLTNVEESGVYPTPPQTPNSPNTYLNYCVQEAALHIERAIDDEINKKYEDAFNEYKLGIDILLKGIKDDKNFERKDMIRRKIEKYLLRAEKIYNLHLSLESKTIQNYVPERQNFTSNDLLNQSESDLYNYKVVKVIGSGMLVLHMVSQKLFYVKVIHKTSSFSIDKLILPETVPYMVNLYTYYNCENALFLMLEYVSGITVKDYIAKLNTEEVFNSSILSNSTSFNGLVVNDFDEESDCSEYSYSDLIFDYALNKTKESKSSSTLGSLNVEDSTLETVGPVDNSEPSKGSDNSNSDIVRSKDALTSTHNTLNNETQKFVFEDLNSEKDYVDISSQKRPELSRKSSEKSEWSWFENVHSNENILLPINEVTKWAAQLLLALQKLHSLGVVCGNLQTKHLLINEKGNLVLCYKCNIQDQSAIILNVDNFVVAPELHTFQPITCAADWWNYGVILYEMLVGLPLGTIYPDGFNSYSALRIPKHVSVEGRSLLRQLLVFDVQERLGSGVNGPEDIKTHPFFNTISWDALTVNPKV
ncbi:hypothetical protein FQA39_LY07035 [Lamprigera yunnana]|nr:hypothetical protein FQA39_LY07035 [Lamprigera yunnana]